MYTLSLTQRWILSGPADSTDAIRSPAGGLQTDGGEVVAFHGREGRHGAGCKAADRVTIAARARIAAVTQFPSLSPNFSFECRPDYLTQQQQQQHDADAAVIAVVETKRG